MLYFLPGTLTPIIIGLVVMILVNKEVTVSGLEKTTSLENSTATRTTFRSNPEKGLSPEAVQIMLKDKGLFDSRRNSSGHGFSHRLEVQSEGLIIYDHASGLRWQQSGSRDTMSYESTKAYISKLNREHFAGYNDWRLPTLEEAVSLMRPTKENGDLHIDPVFDPGQTRVWTSDFRKDAMAWVVRFDSGYCDYTYTDNNIKYYVRALR